MAPYPVMNQSMMAYPPMVSSSKQMRGRSWSPPAPAQKRSKQEMSVEEHVYSRKLKSLGVLAETFVQKHSNIPPETTVIVDDLARSLGVERRRVYDVVNILESMGVVVKKSKNTYLWMGMDNLSISLGKLQEEAIRKYPDDALAFRLISDEQAHTLRQHLPIFDPTRNKSLSRLTQNFIECFLVGHKTMSLPEASDKIHGSVSTIKELAKLGGWVESDEIGNDLAMHKAAAKGLKTKIRRLYDVSNVLFHLGWINKVAPAAAQSKLENDIAPLLLERRPQYQWNYLSAHQIRQAYLEATLGVSAAPVVETPVPLARSAHQIRQANVEDTLVEETPAPWARSDQQIRQSYLEAHLDRSVAPVVETPVPQATIAPMTRHISLEDDGSPVNLQSGMAAHHMGAARRISLDVEAV
jgi:hypothetical protein